ncbi:hypothetical protein Tco_0456260 [Tanacetum coccineum]
MHDQDYEGFTSSFIMKKGANYIYTLGGQAVTRKTLKGRKKLEESHTRTKIKIGTSSMQVLQRVEFKVEPLDDLAFEVEAQGNFH